MTFIKLIVFDFLNKFYDNLMMTCMYLVFNSQPTELQADIRN